MHDTEDIFSFELFSMYLFVRLIHYLYCGLGREGHYNAGETFGPM